MTLYRYEPGFEGFLCAVSRCLADRAEPSGFLRRGVDAETGLFQEMTVDVVRDRETALGFRGQFVSAVTREAFATARYAFHSEAEGIELTLWRYLSLGLKAGKRLGSMLADMDVNQVHRLARSVSREAHKYKGFIRFREVRQGFLYAPMEPAFDILCFLAPHFVQRVGDRPWMIHDLARSQVAVYDLKSWRLLPDVTLADTPGYTDAEHECAGLWQTYFQRLAIRERLNPRLQRQHVPLRSRKHMVEFGTG